MHVEHCALFIVAALITASNGALITGLPGAPTVSYRQYSGYLAAGNNRFLHYWFTESQRNPSTDPLIVWLNGGPGCSSVGGFLTELGPLLVNPDGSTLRVNPYGWNREANIFALEAPAGVGYSYSNSGNVGSSDESTATENYAALRDFFNQFPQYRNSDFYVMGESYGGIYVPTLVQTILDNQSTFHINIKGFSIGNGCVSRNIGDDSIVQFVYNHGMVDEQLWQRAKTECCNGQIDGCSFHSFQGFGFCPSFVNQVEREAWYSGINPYSMYEDCINSGKLNDAIQTRYQLDLQLRFGKDASRAETRLAIPCLNETAVTLYMNSAFVRNAFGIPQNLPSWEFCSSRVGNNYQRTLGEMQSRVQNAIRAGLRGLIYNGDTDMACNFLMGQRFSAALGLTKKVDKREYMVNGQVGGFYTAYNGLEFYTVRASGHMVPQEKPAVAYKILSSFLNQRQP